MFSILLSSVAKKQLEELPQKQRIRIEKAIKSLQEDPFRGKKLLGKLAGRYSLRIWPYRIIYRIIKDKLIISSLSFYL